MMIRPILLVLLLMSGMGSAPFAQEVRSAVPAPGTSTRPAETSTVVFVPYEKAQGPDLTGGQSVLLPYAEFLQLKKAQAAAAPTSATQPRAAIAQSKFEGSIQDSAARFSAEFTVDVLARPTDRLQIPLPIEGASVETAAVEGPRASLAPLAGEGTGMTLQVEGEGRRVLRLQLVVPIRTQDVLSRLEFRVPPAAASSLLLRLQNQSVVLQPDAETLPATLESTTNTPGGGAEIRAACGSRSRLLLLFRQTARPTQDQVKTRLAVEEEMRFTVTARQAGSRTSVNVQVLSGQTDAVTFSVPSGTRLLSVSGPFVKDWSVAGNTRQCKVQLMRPLMEPFSLVLDAQNDTTSGSEPTSATSRLTVPEFRFPDAARESGRIAVLPDPALAIWTEQTDGLEVVSAQGEKIPGAKAFRFSQPGWKLVLSRKATPAHVRSDSTLLYEVTDSLIRLKTRHQLAISGREIYSVTLKIPQNYELRDAGPSQVVSGFRNQGDRVEIMFRGEQASSCTITLNLQRPRAREDEPMRLEPVSVEGAEEDSGYVILAAPEALKVTEKRVANLEAVDVRNLQNRSARTLSEGLQGTLGYRYFARDFSGETAIERQRTRLTCQTSRLVTITPSLLKADTTLDYQVDFSPLDEFLLRLPASAGQDVRIEGADIKEKNRAQTAAGDDSLTTWTVRLQRKVIGTYKLNVSFDVPLNGAESGKTQKVSVPVVRAARVARETGYVAVSRGENLEVRVAQSDGLEPRDIKELPPTLTNAFLGFQYYDPARQNLELEFVRHELEGVLGALIQRMHIESVLNDQGQLMHRVYFEVQNNREPYLVLKLPEQQEILGAFIRGTSVRPTIRQSDKMRLIELSKSQTQGETFRVQLDLRENLPGGPLGLSGKVHFTPPEPQGMPVLQSTWVLYLPKKDFAYVGFKGAMRLETGDREPWMVEALEYFLNDTPVRIAGGIAQQAVKPSVQQANINYNTDESPDEKARRMGADALVIPLVKDGKQFVFARVNGVGDIVVKYWKLKPLVVLQGLLALAVLGLLGTAGFRLKSGWVPVGATIIFFLAASLTSDLTGRLFATALAASGLLTLFVLVRYLYREIIREKNRLAAQRQATQEPEKKGV